MANTLSIVAVNGSGVKRKAIVTEETFNRIQEAERGGAKIIINQSWNFKGRGFKRIEKIVQTNDIVKGYPKHIIWACYK